eukprot:GFUD01031860.1.p1 GENE.GFUD01031860.1~~GFUD01031860.1.p1  ORF type:complete len:652 (+),score=154.25 GFUD01031860.1:264-2219(+)
MGKDKAEKGEVEEVERGSWDNQCDFFLSCLGYAVGLGNVWRFPYLCYEHGGVTFLIAYIVMLLISGLPLFFLELVLGQYAGKGPLKLFGRIAPAFKGLGYGMLMISFLVVIYYNMIIAWTIYYTFAGFASELPWTYCGNTTLTSRDCFQRDQELACFNSSSDDTFWDKKCTSVSEVCLNFNMTEADERDDTNRLMCYNGTDNIVLNRVYPRVSPSEDYYKRTMLGLEEDTSWENMGGLKWELVLCLAAAWTIVCLCLIKGVQSSGKVVYFTALFPYLVLVILLIRGVTLDGAYDGIIFYVYPTAEKMANLQKIDVWAAAATQIFYSLGPSFGGLITLASYNKFTNNCHRDAILIAFANCGTSIFAGFVIFSIIGFMAKQAALPVEEVIKGGTGLAFIAYPEAVTQMPFPQIWSFLFFGMLITLGLDSQFTMTETVTTAIMDQYPNLRAHKGKVVIFASIIGFILGLTMCTRGGIFMFELINWYSASWGLLICAITEILVVMYGYGYKNFLENMEEMGLKLPTVMKYYWLSMWMVITPVVLFFVLIMTFIQYSPAWSPDYSQEKYYFPTGIQFLGWLMALVAAAFIIMGVFWQYYNRKRNGKATDFKSMTSPNEKWGPATVTNAVKKPTGLDNQTYVKDEFSYNKYSADTTY